MKRLKLSTQIVLIIMISLILIPFILVFFAYPEYQKGISESIYESLNYQLELTYADEAQFLDTLYILDPKGKVVVERVQSSDAIAEVALPTIIKQVLSSKEQYGSGYVTLYDRTQVYFSYKKYQDESSRLMLSCHFLKDSILGNEKSLRFMFTLFLCILIPIIIILLWFSYISQSIKSIENCVNNDNKKPLIASKELLALQDSIEVFKTEIKEDTEQKQRLFQNISHELKTPITTIRMYAEGIEDGIFKEGDIKKSTEVIKTETEELLSKVNKIMDINKLYHVETSAVNMRKERIFISEIIFDLLSLYERRAPQVTFHAELEKCEWSGNEDIWNNIFQNIFDNNVKHGAKNIKIKLTSKEILIENDSVHIEDEILHTIFAPFVKGQNGNFGLGLNIVQRSLKLLGYSIDVSNTDFGVLYRITNK